MRLLEDKFRRSAIPPTDSLAITQAGQRSIEEDLLLAKVRLLQSLLDAKVLSRPEELVEVCLHGRHNQQWFRS